MTITLESADGSLTLGAPTRVTIRSAVFSGIGIALDPRRARVPRGLVGQSLLAIAPSPAPGRGCRPVTRPTQTGPAAEQTRLVRSSAAVGAGTLLVEDHRPAAGRRAGLRGRPRDPRRHLQPRELHAQHRLRADPGRGAVGDAWCRCSSTTSSGATTRRPRQSSLSSMTVLAVLTAIAMVFAPLIARLYALDTAGAERTAQLHVMTVFTLWFLPQMLFYGFTALATALLNAHRRFVAAAFAPVVNNVLVIAILVLVRGDDPRRPIELDRRAPDQRRHRQAGAARRGHDRGDRRDGARARAGYSAPRHPPPRRLRVGPPGGAKDAAALGLDRRLRRDEPDRAAVRARAGQERDEGRRVGVPLRVRLLPGAARAASRSRS